MEERGKTLMENNYWIAFAMGAFAWQLATFVARSYEKRRKRQEEERRWEREKIDHMFDDVYKNMEIQTKKTEQKITNLEKLMCEKFQAYTECAQDINGRVDYLYKIEELYEKSKTNGKVKK